eukprot:188221-Chlamydomonas_euryale.AAC.2
MEVRYKDRAKGGIRNGYSAPANPNRTTCRINIRRPTAMLLHVDAPACEQGDVPCLSVLAFVTCLLGALRWCFENGYPTMQPRPKAAAAAEALRRVWPSVDVTALELAVPMPGHAPVNEEHEEKMRQVRCTSKRAVGSHARPRTVALQRPDVCGCGSDDNVACTLSPEADWLSKPTGCMPKPEARDKNPCFSGSI